ncbi:hypothetical protein BCE02nite_52680 [Brevibacillus centrosporus]|jgi:hypothetical protein|nr:hypothetical protein EDM55_19100 [Brevibacillus centrosporus]GED34127.1 hypothetical protein BCE02nite_52680 [Brevibacillus centrosporus]
MKLQQLKVNSELLLYGKKFTVISVDPPNVIIKRESDNEVLTFEYINLISNPTFIPGKSMLKKRPSKILKNFTQF